MANLQKINQRLDKSALDWKKKHHHCQAQLLEATESNLKLTQKNNKLESLCRALQVNFLSLKTEGNTIKTYSLRELHFCENPGMGPG